MQRVLITGGLGFIGANLTEHLLSLGSHELTVLDNFSNTAPPDGVSWRHSPASVGVIRGDIRDQHVCAAAVEGQDVVVHLAANTQVIESLRNPTLCYDVNIQGTINLFEACRQSGVRRFIMASSNAAVGGCDAAINESATPRPLSPYGAAKLAGEGLCSAYCHSYGMGTIALRFSNVYGRYCQQKSSVVAQFMRSIINSKPLTIYGDGTQSRDFIHAADLCRAIALCLTPQADPFAGAVFQVASGVETTITELVHILERVVGVQTQLRFEPARPGEIRKNSSDISKVRDQLGFKPEVLLETGIRLLYEWYQSTPSVVSPGSLLAAQI